MNLKTNLPKGVSESDVIFSLPYDLKKTVGLVSGHLTVDDTFIRVYLKDEEKKIYKIKDFSEIEISEMIGCSVLRGKYPNGEWQAIVTFTQTYFLRFAELAKILDYYINTGIFITETDAEEPTCPNCGRSLGGGQTCFNCQDKGKLFFKLVDRIKPFKSLFAINLIAAIVTYVADIISPYIQRIIIDDMIIPKNPTWDKLAFYVGILFILGVIQMIMYYVMYHSNTKLSSKFGENLRRDIFDKTQELSMASVGKRTAGELISRVSGDTETIQNFVTKEGKDMIFQVLSLVSLCVIMFVVNWRLALFSVVPLPFVFYLSVKVFTMMGKRWMRFWRHQVWASELLHDIIHGIRVIKNYGSEDREVEAYTAASKKWAGSAKKAEKTWYLTMLPLRYLIYIGEFFVLFFGGKMVLGEQLQLGELIQFTSYMYMLYGPIDWLVRLPRALSNTAVSLSKVYEILDERTDVNDRTESHELDIKGDIEFNKVFFGYKAYNPVLKDISCSIKAGEMIGIVGHSGVGKSTFINLVMRLYDPTAGNIKIDGVDLRDIKQTSLRSQVGVVLQETFLFNGSVYDNIRYAKPDASFEEIVEAAKVANCHDFITRLPDGYNTFVGERGYNLSGGERQRVAIARAILHNPKVIILDEATASLDTETEKQIQEALGRLTKGRTTIAIAHRLSTLREADRLIVLDKGRVAEIGTHKELMESGGVYYSLVMAQRQTARINKINKTAESMV